MEFELLNTVDTDETVVNTTDDAKKYTDAQHEIFRHGDGRNNICVEDISAVLKSDTNKDITVDVFSPLANLLSLVIAKYGQDLELEDIPNRQTFPVKV